MAQIGAWFSGAIAMLLIAATGLVYGFGRFEPALGRGTSLQIALGAGIVLSIIGAFGFFLAAKARNAYPTCVRALVAGGTFEVLICAVIEGAKYLLPILNSLP